MLLDKNMKKGMFVGILQLILIVTFIEAFVASINGYIFLDNLEKRVDRIIQYEGKDIDLLCNITKCSYITLDNVNYKFDSNKNTVIRSDKIKIESDLLVLHNEPLIRMYYNNDVIIYSNLTGVFNMMLVQYTVLVVLLIVIYILYYLNIAINNNNNKSIESFVDKMKLETRVQNEVAESAYHDMTTPVSNIGTGIEEVMSIVYETPLTRDTKKIIDIFKEKYPVIINSIYRLESVLNQMSFVKHNKKSGNTKTSIAEMVKVAEASMKLEDNKIDFNIQIDNEELLEKVTTKITTTGTMINLFHNQIKNSVEAGSTVIIFSGKVVKDKLELYITDNGNGIPNIKDGNFEVIFELGYSSKDKQAIEEVKNSIPWYMKLFSNYLSKKINIDDLLKRRSSTRGFGMFITREILLHDNGNIKVVESGNTGTLFKLWFPFEYIK